jgi:hypothetical protein
LFVAEVDTQTCDNEVFQARCSHSAKILVTQARFAHIEVSRCVNEIFASFGSLGCYANITDLIGQRCNGKNRCDIDDEDPSVLATKECTTGLPMYMDISYVCKPGKYIPAVVL